MLGMTNEWKANSYRPMPDFNLLHRQYSSYSTKPQNKLTVQTVRRNS